MSKKRVDNTVRQCPVCGDAMTDDDPREFCCPLCETIGDTPRTWSLPGATDSPRTCAYCGATYSPSRPEQRYCSEKCSANHKRGKVKPDVLYCQECGAQFTPRSKAQKYCSGKCCNAHFGRKYRADAAVRMEMLAKSHEVRTGNAMPTEERLTQLYEAARASGHCPYCGQKTDEWSLDHIVPVSRGGSNLLHNLIFICPHCNSAKGARPLDAFLLRHLPHTLCDPEESSI